MTDRTIVVKFDGQALVPEVPLSPADTPPKFADLLNLAADLEGAPTDLSVRHKQLCGRD